MPFFTNSPSPRSQLIEQGWPVYLFGSRNSLECIMQISAVSLTSNVATITVTSWSGPLPIVGSGVTVRGVAAGAAFNVTNATVTAVALDVNGSGTVSYAATNANVGLVGDGGRAYFRFVSVGDVLTSAGAASIAGSVRHPINRSENSLSGTVTLTGVSAATVALQGSNTQLDADFTDISTIPITANKGIFNAVHTTFEFVRFNATAVTGTGTITATINA